ncbi:hypothetical protein NUV26_08380 [Burkholderia pseudomultivorans]|uniref:hypothetical protein n=1 Tax=Burkholderia pseudomultivorans TaxID=1207504 RepID=UPI0001FD8150|nr:hypothetical protein [Burkholderia pseudomultivorans]EGD01106.1 hypothetical protein B1M_28261 [Burkholderia sp. TJI49]AOI92458.1 hypothetical protein WS57_27650 [Burkholderia pseudomultivorans]KVC35490.1 hypothetical protein WS56_08175 [Burkholderia pseudomultivorans]KVC38465.1 hypothetical protein WS55_27160 [Burkholderia pseudomultivorans]KVC49365.1 hypothetical protein WS58_07325 [Burkholderia pseudomultivorans]
MPTRATLDASTHETPHAEQAAAFFFARVEGRFAVWETGLRCWSARVSEKWRVPLMTRQEAPVAGTIGKQAK